MFQQSSVKESSRYPPQKSLIINELNDKKKDEKKIYILDHCSVGRKNFNNKKINYIVITNFLDLAKKIKTILNVVKNSN